DWGRGRGGGGARRAGRSGSPLARTARRAGPLAGLPVGCLPAGRRDDPAGAPRALAATGGACEGGGARAFAGDADRRRPRRDSAWVGPCAGGGRGGERGRGGLAASPSAPD